MEQFVSYIIGKIVENADKVSVTSSEEYGNTVINVTAASGQIGRIIGKRGRMINAITRLTNMYASQSDTSENATGKIFVRVQDPLSS